MRRIAAVLLAAATACGSSGDDEDLGVGFHPPDEWDPPACSWEDRVERPDDVFDLDTAVDVAVTTDSGLVVASDINDAGGRGMWLRRYQPTGEVRWTRQSQSGVVSGHIDAIALDADDRVGVTGEVDEDAGRLDFWIAAYDAGGEPLWSVDLDNAGRGADACFGPGGELFVTGSLPDPAYKSSTLIWVGKLSAGGELLWSHTDPGAGEGFENAGEVIVCDPDGGATVMARITVPGGPESIGPDIHTWIRRYDAAGEEIWTQTLGEEFERSEPGTMMAHPVGGGLLVTSGGRRYRLEVADGAIAEDLPGFGAAILAADPGGAYIEGNFGVREEPGCTEPEEECDDILYWGYAYVDWQGELVWWRADTAGSVDVGGAVRAIAVVEGVLAIAGRAENDIWVCYE
jgi:hypothetical protein